MAHDSNSYRERIFWGLLREGETTKQKNRCREHSKSHHLNSTLQQSICALATYMRARRRKRKAGSQPKTAV